MEFEVPHRLRAIVRARESSLILLAAAVGALAGLVVAAMSLGVDLLHSLFFDLPYGQRLSALARLDPVLALVVPTLGGVMLGVAYTFISAWRPVREVDPIEANALHGGRMSFNGSMIVALETVWSTGVGASVGMEAGYTQLAGGIASRVGRAFRLRRADLRMLVGCGAAGGIAGAFGAPLAGAFYGFELVIGNYSVTSLAPVGLSSLIGYLVAGSLASARLGMVAPQAAAVTNQDLFFAVLLGLVMALFGIALMRGVYLFEALLNRLRLAVPLKLAVGGVIVGLFATVTPQVMSSGHGALRLSGLLDLPLRGIATILVLKALASIVSLGSGFRGGLFFSSLLMGALGGQLFASAINTVDLALHLDSDAYAVIGMSALSAAVIGGPLTMIFVALESTGNLWLTAAVLIAVIISAQVTRELFGYSFATWRFHLRGETIRSAADIGWLRDLTVGRMMRRDVKTISSEMTVPAFREAFPPGSTGQVVAVDNKGRYAGLVMVAEAHAAELAESAFIFEILRHADDMLLPSMTVQEAISAFDRTESEVLAVVDAPSSRRVLGTLSEAHALRRYLSELELQRREYVGAP
ncbi:MAG TPA: chloride channel protein [Xanthobacteraceae bacterium]|nr:chloride channel protein [Xanthobacteraceae bacterium]